MWASEHAIPSKTAQHQQAKFDQQMENGSLVIELDISLKSLDEVYAFTSYKLYREHKNWTDAELHCKSEGGQLASIHSPWEQKLAQKAAV